MPVFARSSRKVDLLRLVLRRGRSRYRRLLTHPYSSQSVPSTMVLDSVFNAFSWALPDSIRSSASPTSSSSSSATAEAMRRHEHRLVQFGLDWWNQYLSSGRPDHHEEERSQDGIDGVVEGPAITSGVQASMHDLAIKGFYEDDGSEARIHFVRYSPPSSSSFPQNHHREEGVGAEEEEDGEGGAMMMKKKVIKKNKRKKNAPFLLLPGYACGLGVFYSSAPVLAERLDTQVLAVDQFGCGLSSRPRWTGGFKDDDTSREQMETLFVDSLEAFRKALGEEKISLVGHSMGGYLASCYALKYPERIEHLVLASPVGIPRPPKDNPLSPSSSSSSSFSFSAPVRSTLTTIFMSTVKAMWGSGYGPFNITWGMDPLLRRYFMHRFRDNGIWFNGALLHPYFRANLINGNPSLGGYSHAVLLYPGAYAKRPLEQRLPSLLAAPIKMRESGEERGAMGVQDGTTQEEERGRVQRGGRFPFSLTFLYGTHDWMDFRHAIRFRQRLDDPTCVSIGLVAESGHNLQMENPLGFVDALAACLEGKSDGKNNRRRRRRTRRRSEERATSGGGGGEEEEEEEGEGEVGDEGGRQHRMGKSGEAYITMASGDDGKQTMTIPLPPVFGQSYVTPERRDRVYQ